MISAKVIKDILLLKPLYIYLGIKGAKKLQIQSLVMYMRLESNISFNQIIICKNKKTTLCDSISV